MIFIAFIFGFLLGLGNVIGILLLVGRFKPHIEHFRGQLENPRKGSLIEHDDVEEDRNEFLKKHNDIDLTIDELLP